MIDWYNYLITTYWILLNCLISTYAILLLIDWLLNRSISEVYYAYTILLINQSLNRSTVFQLLVSQRGIVDWYNVLIDWLQPYHTVILWSIADRLYAFAQEVQSPPAPIFKNSKLISITVKPLPRRHFSILKIHQFLNNPSKLRNRPP